MIHSPAKHVVFTGGGTGGHLFPGLAVGRWMVSRWPDMRITFAGCGKPFVKEQVEAAGFEYVRIRCHPAPRRARDAWRFVVENVAGYRAGGRFLDQQPADVVVGLGGYASVPLARAAIGRNIPLVLLEQNAMPGRATRWLAPSASMVCLAFGESREFFKRGASTRVTGTPLRDGFSAASEVPPQIRNRLLIVGGSGGARSLNRHVPPALGEVISMLADWEIVHQTGAEEVEATRRLYRRLRLPATVVSFIPDMAVMLRTTKLAVCRAGGTTLAEMAQSGVPAILLPYPYATDDHQRKNAEAFAASGGCLVLDGREPGGPMQRHLQEALSDLLRDAEKRGRMSRAVRRRASPDATQQVAEVVRRLAT